MFGQILAALYQEDIVEEDDIRNWYKKPSAQGEGVKPPASQENFKKCWTVGAHMIKQFDEQESEEEDEDEEGDDDVKPGTLVPQPPGSVKPQMTSEDDEGEEDDDDDESEEGEEESE